MVLVFGFVRWVLVGFGQFGFGGFGVLRCGVYEWGVCFMWKLEFFFLDRVYEIFGLEFIIYVGKMYFVFWLVWLIFLFWELCYRDLRFYCLFFFYEYLLYKEQVCYIFYQCCCFFEGVKQVFWFIKIKLIEGFFEKVFSFIDDLKNYIEN